MENFEFHNPVRIIFGKETIGRIGSEARAFGRKALLIYGQGSIKRNGVYAQVTQSLQDAGVAAVELPGVQSNPLLSKVLEGITSAKTEHIDVIVAVGGGSVIDTAKAIAGGVYYNGDVWDFFVGKGSFEKALPICTVLTIPATGSEMNSGLVITHDETLDKLGGFSPALFPKVSICDPMVSFSIPERQIAYSVVDAISHLLEGYFTRQARVTPLQDAYVEGVVRSLREAADRIFENPEAYEPRATLMWGASLAWNGIALAGLGAFEVPCHMLEHPMSALYPLAHGAGLAVTLPAWMRWQAQRSPHRLAQFARRIWGIEEREDRKAAGKGIEAFVHWLRQIQAPVCLKEAGIPDADTDRLTVNARRIAQAWGMERYDERTIREIYGLCR